MTVNPRDHRDEHREAVAEAEHLVWRHGGNPHSVDHDRIDDALYGGQINHARDAGEAEARRVLGCRRRLS